MNPVTIDPWWIIVELAVSGSGFVLFTYGRRQERMPQLLGGLACMLFPFFVSSLTGLLAGAVIIVAGTWWAIRLGW